MDITIAQYATGVQLQVINSCENNHVFDQMGELVHGTSFLNLRWYYSEPTTVFARAGVDLFTGEAQHEFVVGRDLLATALRSGASAGYPIIGEGNVTCKVMRGMDTMMSIRFNGNFQIIVHRDALTAWLTGTFKHVPLDQEERILDIESVISQLLIPRPGEFS